MAADLHCHTKLSDGSVGIEDLIVIAQKSGIDTIAITDHDCLAGTVRGKVIGKRYGVNVIPGVEISAIDNEAGKRCTFSAIWQMHRIDWKGCASAPPSPANGPGRL